MSKSRLLPPPDFSHRTTSAKETCWATFRVHGWRRRGRWRGAHLGRLWIRSAPTERIPRVERRVLWIHFRPPPAERYVQLVVVGERVVPVVHHHFTGLVSAEQLEHPASLCRIGKRGIDWNKCEVHWFQKTTILESRG
jgi:hypothetical protein